MVVRRGGVCMCDLKTMIKFGVVIAAFLALGFIFFPPLRAVIVGLAPFALFAICPLMMLFCMKGMSDKKEGSCSECEHKHKKETVEKKV